jgi:hypothetical protein
MQRTSYVSSGRISPHLNKNEGESRGNGETMKKILESGCYLLYLSQYSLFTRAKKVFVKCFFSITFFTFYLRFPRKETSPFAHQE